MNSSHVADTAFPTALPRAAGGSSVLFRWVAFNAIGVAGMVVQLGVVAFLVHMLRVHYVAATVAGVEAAILHNFAWHQRWTWRDRPTRRVRDRAARLARFHLLNGSI